MSGRTVFSRLLGACALSLAIGNAHASPSAPAPESLNLLLATMNERLNIADQVALSKWDSGKPIQDSAREAQVIGNARMLAKAHQLDPDAVAELLAAQIEGNKLVQYGLLAQWQGAGKAPDVPRSDLSTQIRAQLDELQTRLLQQYAAFATYRNDPGCSRWVDQARSALAKDPLHKLALIRVTGELCSGGKPR